MTYHETDRHVLRRANSKLDFYSHLVIFVLINLMLFGLNMMVTPTITWFIFPLAGWGLGLLVHGTVVFAPRAGELKEKLVKLCLTKRTVHVR